MKKAKVFRYHVFGLLFWTAIASVAYVLFCKLTLPAFLQDSALGDALGLFAIPGFALCLWIFGLAEGAIGGSYDEPTEWDELAEQIKKSRPEMHGDSTDK